MLSLGCHNEQSIVVVVVLQDTIIQQERLPSAMVAYARGTVGLLCGMVSEPAEAGEPQAAAAPLPCAYPITGRDWLSIGASSGGVPGRGVRHYGGISRGGQEGV